MLTCMHVSFCLYAYVCGTYVIFKILFPMNMPSKESLKVKCLI